MLKLEEDQILTVELQEPVGLVLILKVTVKEEAIIFKMN
jgi:hypothetical protein